jgi:hypothetical protein
MNRTFRVHPLFNKDSRNRPPDWRWQLAGHLLKHHSGFVPESLREEVLCEAVYVRRAVQQQGPGDEGLLALMELSPSYYDAWDLYRADDGSARWEIEARLLAREPMAEIARKVGVSEEAVSVYEALFFNVLDRLDCPGYIMHAVLGPILQNRAKARDLGCLWKMFGYWHGPVMLDEVIYGASQSARPGNTADVMAALDTDIFNTLRAKVAAAGHALTLRPDEMPEIFKLYSDLRKIEQNNDSAAAGTAEASILANVEACMSRLPWEKSDSHRLMPTSQVQAELQTAGVSLRTRELLLMASGGLPQETVKLLATARYPDQQPR